MELPDHPFWDFSLQVHQRPGVSDACLALQRAYGLDVNILFFLCWTAVCEGRPLDRKAIETALDAVAGWQDEIVRPIWKARWRLKGGFGAFPFDRTESLRKALLATELEAEHMEQLLLADAVPVQTRPEPDDGARLSAAAANLASGLAACLPYGATPQGNRPPDDLVTPLRVLLAGVFPCMSMDGIHDELSRALERGKA